MNTVSRTLILLCILFYWMGASVAAEKIDRKRVVERHNILSNTLDEKSPAQAGNGEFAFSVDITGLQTFVPFNTMSDWGWHSDLLPDSINIADYKGQLVDTYGRKVRYPLRNEDTPEQKAIFNWLAGNPHKINLGRLSFVLLKKDGEPATFDDLKNCRQEVNLWTGIISSDFELEGIPVHVKTACHPTRDIVAVTVDSKLIQEGRLAVKLEFPYASAKNSEKGRTIGVWDEYNRHQTTVRQKGNRVDFSRTLDKDHYFVSLEWSSKCQFERNETNPHQFNLKPSETALNFTCEFSPTEINGNAINTKECLAASETGWRNFWNSGAAIDLSGSTDERWFELERRIVLSRYAMRVNEAGSLPPQEGGLVNNGWYGKFHFEMFWWHGVHWALWNNWNLLDKSLGIYQRYLDSAKKRAEDEGFKGARWPKCTAYENVEWPHPCHAFLIWQQPHPIYFAELDYRLHPQKETLEKWKDVVFNTADFLSSVAHYDSLSGKYVLGPPLIPVSENVNYAITLNPTFELGYWRWGLRVVEDWYRRLGMTPPKSVQEVLDNLAPLPVQNDTYVLYEGVQDMWTKFNYEHPALTGVYGWLPGDGVDLKIMEPTFDKILSVWNFKKVWGWDFPMLAMTAARLNKPELAVDLLLHDNFKFDQHGLAYGEGSPYAYFPSNGGLLTAIAMMVDGWDGNTDSAPGFPKNGKWKVRYEGFNKMP